MSPDDADQSPLADPPDAGGTTEIPDEPMGVPADAEPDSNEQPGIPDSDPPSSG